MPATRYKIWAWGPPVGKGATGAAYVGVAGVAKKASAVDPYIVANEVVCNAFARLLLLPCPPGATLDKSGDLYFFSLDFNLAGQALPPADSSAVVANQPRLAWGIVLFDALIMNFDRHEENIAYDVTTGKVQIFDHSHAFLHAGANPISATLAAHDGQLCIGNHCLAKELCDPDGLDIWTDRISQIPDFFIEGVIDAACGVGIPLANKADCVGFLKKRRSEMRNIVNANLWAFPKLPKAVP